MRVIVVGDTGLAGSEISARFNELNWKTFGINTSTLDLFEQEAVLEFLHSIKPDLMVDAARGESELMTKIPFRSWSKR